MYRWLKQGCSLSSLPSAQFPACDSWDALIAPGTLGDWRRSDSDRHGRACLMPSGSQMDKGLQYLASLHAERYMVVWVCGGLAQRDKNSPSHFPLHSPRSCFRGRRTRRLDSSACICMWVGRISPSWARFGNVPCLVHFRKSRRRRRGSCPSCHASLEAS